MSSMFESQISFYTSYLFYTCKYLNYTTWYPTWKTGMYRICNISQVSIFVSSPKSNHIINKNKSIADLYVSIFYHFSNLRGMCQNDIVLRNKGVYYFF